MKQGITFTDGELYEYPNEVVNAYYRRIARMLDEINPPKRKDDSILEMVKIGEPDVVVNFMEEMENKIERYPNEVDLIISFYNPKKYSYELDFSKPEWN